MKQPTGRLALAYRTIATLEERIKDLESQALEAVKREWTSITERMPQCGVIVLAFYVNSAGRNRRIRAEYIERWAVVAEVCTDPDSECVEYSESADQYYLLEGWYESIDNWPDYSRVAVIEGDVTHWMRLPAAPDEQPSTPRLSRN